MPTMNNSGRQTLTGKDGVQLERRYLYLKSETWAALYALVQATQTNQSTLIEQLLATAGKELENHDTYTCN